MKILYVADAGGHFISEVGIYEKRLKGLVEWIRIRPIKHVDRSFVIRQETQKVIEILSKFRKKAWVLDEFGTQYTTLDFSKNMQTLRNEGHEVIFVVGGSFGLDRELLAPHTEQTLSISDFTLPHGLALLVLSEQIYRIHEIWKGSKYHHE